LTERLESIDTSVSNLSGNSTSSGWSGVIRGASF
jgi:hypothetical protein